MLEFINQRDSDYIASCRKICDGLRPGERLSCHELAKRAIMSGAPSYYITFDYAYRQLRSLRNNRLPPGQNELKRLMWSEIALKTDQCKERMRIRADFQALSLVLARNSASRFFITVEYGIRLLQQLNHDYKIKYNVPLLLVPYSVFSKPSKYGDGNIGFCC